MKIVCITLLFGCSLFCSLSGSIPPDPTCEANAETVSYASSTTGIDARAQLQHRFNNILFAQRGTHPLCLRRLP